MAIYFQHVGEQGGKRDFPKTIGTTANGLLYFQLSEVPEVTQRQQALAQVFNCYASVQC